MLYWKFLAEGGTVAGNPRLGGGEENPPALLPGPSAAAPWGWHIPWGTLSLGTEKCLHLLSVLFFNNKN